MRVTPVVNMSPVLALEFRPNFLAGVVVGAVGTLAIVYLINHPETLRKIERGY